MARKLLKAPVRNDLAEPRSQQKGTIIQQNIQSFAWRNRALRKNRDSCFIGLQPRPLTTELALIFEMATVRKGGIFSGLSEKMKSSVLNPTEALLGSL